jgi:hypothetical protein
MFPKEEQKSLEKIIGEIFPRAQRAFGNTSYDRSWYGTWDKDKRIASPEYFHRYFGYGISDDDISDFSLRSFSTESQIRRKKIR